MSLFGFNINKHAWQVTLMMSVLYGLMIIGAHAGTSFTAPRVVNSDVATSPALYYAASPAVAAGTSGTLVALWTGLGPNPVNAQGNDSSTANPGNEDIFFSRSADHGRTWSPRAQLKTAWAADDADDLEPAIATDGAGRWIAVWRSRDSLGGTLGYDADILAAISTNDGRTWSAPAPVNADAAADPGKEDFAPRIATDGKGCWVVSWTVLYVNTKGNKVEGIFASRSTDNGAHWSAIFKLLGRNYTSLVGTMGMVSSLAADGQGHWVIATNGGLTGSQDSDIIPIISEDNGASWSRSTYLLNSNAYRGYDDQVPSIATDRNGTWIAAWPTNVIDPNTANNPNPTYNIWFSRSTDNGQSWAPMAQLNSAPETGSANNAGVHLANDGKGNWVAVWYTRQWGGDFDLAYAISRDGGLTWGPAAPLSSDAFLDSSADGGNCKALDLATDRQGHWLALWESDSNPLGAANGNKLILSAALSAAEIAAAPTPVQFLEGTRLAVDVTKNGKPTTATLTLRSTGLTPLTISALQIGGPQAADFSIQGAPTLPLTLAPGASQALAVRFAPVERARALGLAGKLTVTSDDAIHPELAIPFIGDAVPVSLSQFTAD